MSSRTKKKLKFGSRILLNEMKWNKMYSKYELLSTLRWKSAPLPIKSLYSSYKATYHDTGNSSFFLGLLNLRAVHELSFVVKYDQGRFALSWQLTPGARSTSVLIYRSKVQVGLQCQQQDWRPDKTSKVNVSDIYPLTRYPHLYTPSVPLSSPNLTSPFFVYFALQEV